jgi:hypothetical protein
MYVQWCITIQICNVRICDNGVLPRGNTSNEASSYACVDKLICQYSHHIWKNMWQWSHFKWKFVGVTYESVYIFVNKVKVSIHIWYDEIRGNGVIPRENTPYIIRTRLYILAYGTWRVSIHIPYEWIRADGVISNRNTSYNDTHTSV